MAERNHITEAIFLRNHPKQIYRQTYASKTRPYPDIALENKGVWPGESCLRKTTRALLHLAWFLPGGQRVVLATSIFPKLLRQLNPSNSFSSFNSAYYDLKCLPIYQRSPGLRSYLAVKKIRPSP
jgi:hypothetical protein